MMSPKKRPIRIGKTRMKNGGVVDVIDSNLQSKVSEMRKSGLNIMMSMKNDAKPVSFIEDCAVELKDLAEYTCLLYTSPSPRD